MSTKEDENTLNFLKKVFNGNSKHVKEYSEQLKEHKDGQDPITTTITCCDSRVMERSIIGNKELGEDFTHEVIGNHVLMYDQQGKPVVSGSIDYIPKHTETPTVVAVIGHTGCGAITATYNTLKEIEKEQDLEELNLQKLALKEHNGETKGINAEICLILESGLIADYQNIKDTGNEVNKLVEKNVDNQINMLKKNTDYQNTTLVGMVYDMSGNYEGKNGQLYLTNIGGETNIENLKQKMGKEDGIRVKRLNK